SGSCNAELLAERVRSEIANAKYSHGAASFHITVSLGVACARSTSTVDKILKEADGALYKAKKTKNTVSAAH
ncbi:MAG: diguanylate cyclase, partial [Chloroflexi bacterium]